MAQSASAPSAPSLESLGLARDRPLVVVDVDEVLGLFMQSFGAFIAERGYELRFERFALFQNIYRPGAGEPVDLAEGRELFNEFFRTGCGEIEPAPGNCFVAQRFWSQARPRTHSPGLACWAAACTLAAISFSD